MTRIKALTPEQATGKTNELFDAVKRQLGVVPNMMRTMGNSPALLEGYLSLSNILGKGKLGSRTGELLALTVAQNNSCDYCLSAHSFIGSQMMKIDGEVLSSARSANSTDAKTGAILKFAKILIVKNGLVNDQDVNEVKAANVTDEEIAEIIGHVALNVLTNYFNNVAGTEIDFPVVSFDVAEV